MTKDELIAQIEPDARCVLVRALSIHPTMAMVTGEVVALGHAAPPYLSRRRVKFSGWSFPSFKIGEEAFHVVRVDNILDIEVGHDQR